MRLYVYALSATSAESFECAGRRVEFIEAGGVFAASVRSDTRPSLTEAALREQHDVVAAIGERVDAIIPARFGSLVDRDDLERVVELRREAINEALALVRGREQMTIRVFGLEPTTAPPRQAPPATGTAYLEQRKAAAQWTMPPEAGTLVGAVRHLVAAERVVRGEGRVLGTMYHLVQRGASAEYSRSLEAVRKDVPELPFIVSGPWPPFAFAPELWT